MRARDLAWAAPYCGMPVRELGRDRDGVDCWGLYRLVVEELTGFRLPTYVADYASTEECAEIEAVIHRDLRRFWVRVDPVAVRPLDLALFRRGGLDSHVGAVVSAEFFLHAMGTVRTSVGRFDHPLYRSSLAGFWRHRGMPEFRP